MAKPGRSLRLVFYSTGLAASIAILAVFVLWLRGKPSSDIVAQLHATSQSYLRSSVSGKSSPILATAHSIAIYGGPDATTDFLDLGRGESSILAARVGAGFVSGDEVSYSGKSFNVTSESELQHSIAEQRDGVILLESQPPYYVNVVSSGPLFVSTSAVSDLVRAHGRLGAVDFGDFNVQVSSRYYNMATGYAADAPYDDVSSRLRLDLADAGAFVNGYDFSCCGKPFKTTPFEEKLEASVAIPSPEHFHWDAQVKALHLEGYAGTISTGDTSTDIVPSRGVRMEFADGGTLTVEDGNVSVNGRVKSLTLLSPEPSTDMSTPTTNAPVANVLRSETTISVVDQAKSPNSVDKANILPTRWSASGPLRDFVSILIGAVAAITLQLMFTLLERRSRSPD